MKIKAELPASYSPPAAAMSLEAVAVDFYATLAAFRDGLVKNISPGLFCTWAKRLKGSKKAVRVLAILKFIEF